MELSWGIDLWDRLDHIIDHTNASSVLIDKSQKCFIECHHVWTKAAHKQKRLLERLQMEIKDSGLDEFTLTASLLSFINNLTSICNIESTFQYSIAKATDDYLKKTHAHIKKESNSWSFEKRKMEDDLTRERKKYEAALKRYRDKYQAMVAADDNLKKSQDNRALSRSQVDMSQNCLYAKKDEYEESKRDYAVELTNFNNLQQTHFTSSVVDWAKEGEKLYGQKISLLKNISKELAKFTKEMVKNLSYSITRFTDISEALSFDKDAVLLVQKYKTGDVPPVELQFINLDNKQYGKKSKQRTHDVRDVHDGLEESSDSDSSTSSFESNVCVGNPSTLSGSFSSMQVSTNTRSEPGRQSVHDVKMRNTGKVVNPEAKLSIHKSNKIFRSSTPWKANEDSEKPPMEKQKSLYQRRGRSTVRESGMQQRSHSVSEMISNVIKSSFRKKKTEEPRVRTKHKTSSPEMIVSTRNQPESSDFDTDSSYEKCASDNHQVRLKVVSTPAEAVALTVTINKIYTDPVQASMERVENETNGDDTYEYSYVGSCVSCHDFDSDDPLNNYLSFKAGDQFYILTMDDGSGWLLVETVDQSVRGYVPTSYMEIAHYERQSEDVI